MYVAPIGDVGKSGSPDPLYRYEIVYARLVREDGTSVEYGAGAPVASNPPATPAQELTIAAYPNPFYGAANASSHDALIREGRSRGV